MTNRTLEALEIELISILGSDHMNRGLTLRAASTQAAKLVETYRAAVLADYTPATGGMPATPKLAPGDELIVVTPETKYREQEIDRVRVTHMARYKVRVEWLEPRTSYSTAEDFDVRTRYVWHDSRSDRLYSGGSRAQFFTEDQWAYEQRARLADAYLRERRIFPSSVGGPLAELYRDDRLGFANALRRLEGLVEL